MNRGLDMQESQRADRRIPAAIFALCSVLWLATVASWWPGIMTWDAEVQYGQALSGEYTDWHPPIMSRLWALFLPFVHGSAPIFLIHVVLYWSFIALIANALAKIERVRGAFATIAIAALPPFFAFNGVIFSDVGMAISFLGIFALAFHYRSRSLPIPLIAYVAIGVLLFYGCLVRINGVFAAAPLIVYVFWPSLRTSFWKLPLALGAIVVLWIPLTGVINANLLGAKREYAMRSLRIYDIVGIAAYSGDMRVFSYNPQITPKLIDQCYSPNQWDAIYKGDCAKIGYLSGGVWIKQIVTHPVAYGMHRLAHLNSEVYAIAPVVEDRYTFKSKYPDLQRNRLERLNASLLTASTNFVIFAPALTFVLAIAILLLSFFRNNLQRAALSDAAFYSALASVAYTSAFVVVGVASEYRYEQFPMLAALLSLVFYLGARPAGRWSINERLAMVAVAATAAVLIGARLML